MRSIAVFALVCLAGCSAPRRGAVDVPVAPASETRAEAVAPVVHVVAGRADTLAVADLLGPGVDAAWGVSPDVLVRDVGAGRVVVAAREGFSGLAVVPYTVGGAPRGLAVEAAVEPVVTFRYSLAPGRPAPADVHVIGGFNDWSRTADRLAPDGSGGLALTRAVAPGRYEYKLVVDGQEVLDPASRDSTLNPFGAYNNVLTVASATPGRLRLSAAAPAADPSYLTLAAARDDAAGTDVPLALAPGDVVALVDNEPLGPDFVTATGGTVTVDLAALPAGLHRLRVAVRQDGLASRWVEALLLDGRALGERQAALDPAETDAAAAGPFVWQDAVVYQVVLDRFRNGDRTNDRPVVTDGLLPPANYHGGDLQGLLDAIEAGYFTGLGVNTLWISPVVDNPPGAEREFPEPHRFYTGYHGYWPSHPRAVDEHLGDLPLLQRTVAAAHARGIRVLLDIVAHHVHESHPYFREHPEWFGALELPDGSLNLRRFDEYRLTTWFEPYLPSFDFTASQAAIDQVAEDAVWWLRETRADGFRHDAVKHIPNTFWRALTERVRDEPARDVPVYQIGETFGSYGLVSSYVVPGQLDAQFNFLLYDAAIAAFARGGSMRTLADEMDRSLAVYGPLHVMGNLLGSHDKTRFMAFADGDVPPGTNEAELGWGPDAPRVDDAASYRKMELGLAYLLTTPGVPVVYYGDEIGLTGAADPDNRRPMPWADLGAALAPEQTALREAAARLAALRRDLPALRHGAFETLRATETLWVYRRTSPDSDVVVALNAAAAPADVRLAGVPTAAAADALDASAPVADADGLAFAVPGGGYRVVVVR